MTLRTLSYIPAVVVTSDDCHKMGYVIDSTGINGQGHAVRRAVEWDEYGMCHTNFFDSLIDIDRWCKLPLKKREEIEGYVKEGRHDLAVHEFEEEEHDIRRDRTFGCIGLSLALGVMLWIIISFPFLTNLIG